MARILFQLLCTALTLAFFYYQNNAHTLQAKPQVDHAFPAKRIIVSNATDRAPTSAAINHPDEWLLPFLDRFFTQIGLPHDDGSAGYFSRADASS